MVRGEEEALKNADSPNNVRLKLKLAREGGVAESSAAIGLSLQGMEEEQAQAEERARALSLWALCSVAEDDELGHIPAALRQGCLEQQEIAGDIDGRFGRSKSSDPRIASHS